MDVGGLLKAIVEFVQANWAVIEPLARRLAEDIAAAWVLLLALAKIIKSFLPKQGEKLETKVLGVFKS